MKVSTVPSICLDGIPQMVIALRMRSIAGHWPSRATPDTMIG